VTLKRKLRQKQNQRTNWKMEMDPKEGKQYKDNLVGKMIHNTTEKLF
jgi:hypothetical protein